MAPQPARVWLVRAGNPEAVPGSLALERSSITFTPDGEEEALPIPRSRVSRARRRRGAPILELTYTDARAQEARVYLYFAPPPPLPGQRDAAGRKQRVSWISPSRGLQRAASARSLGTAARALRTRIDAWVEAIASG